MKMAAVYTLASVLLVSSSAYAACDTAKLQEAMHWSANNAGLPLEDSIKHELARIEQTWPGTNNGFGMAQCMYRQGRKCMIQQARDARDKGFHDKAAAIGRATQMHNPAAIQQMSACSVQQISDAIGGT